MLSPIVVIIVLMLYLGVLMLFSYFTSRNNESNSDFFIASRGSKWYLVALGMIGSSVSGISLVAVPVMVISSGFTYLQMCLGFVVGYIIVAMGLLPVYYKNNFTSIYGYLSERFGSNTHKTASWFFIISKIITSASKLYVAVLVLQQFLFSFWNVPIWLTVIICVMMIWLYTFRGGIKTIVFTDALQTVVLFATIIFMIINIINLLGFSPLEAIKTISHSDLSKTFIFSDFVSDKNFFKQFFSGIFIVVAMTGLSQDMMQTTLSCRNIKEAQKNMLSYGVCFVPLNLLLLSLGALMVIFASNNNIDISENVNNLVPMFASKYFSSIVAIVFIIGILAATFNSADSALTSIATIFFVDIIKKNDNSQKSINLRKIVYLVVCVVFIFVILLFSNIKNKSLLDTIYTIVGYAYGPLLGMFAVGLFTKLQLKDKLLPFIAIAAPILTYAIAHYVELNFKYRFGYEILLINAILMIIMMFLIKKRNSSL